MSGSNLKLEDGRVVTVGVEYLRSELPKDVRRKLLDSRQFQNRGVPEIGRSVEITLSVPRKRGRGGPQDISFLHRLPLRSKASWKHVKRQALVGFMAMVDNHVELTKTDKQRIAALILPELGVGRMTKGASSSAEAKKTRRTRRIYSSLGRLAFDLEHCDNVALVMACEKLQDLLEKHGDRARAALKTVARAKG